MGSSRGKHRDTQSGVEGLYRTERLSVMGRLKVRLLVKGTFLLLSNRNSRWSVAIRPVLWLDMAKKEGGLCLKIWLRPEAAALVAQSIDCNVFLSMSDFFETVLLVYQEHLQAGLDYVEREEAKGLTQEDIFGLLKTQITYRRPDN